MKSPKMTSTSSLRQIKLSSLSTLKSNKIHAKTHSYNTISNDNREYMNTSKNVNFPLTHNSRNEWGGAAEESDWMWLLRRDLKESKRRQS